MAVIQRRRIRGPMFIISQLARFYREAPTDLNVVYGRIVSNLALGNISGGRKGIGRNVQ